jgi:hypothetical protein
MNKLTATLLSLALVLLGVTSVMAQTNSGRVEGTVHDASGAVIPNAKVSALNVTTGSKVETTASTQGLYVFPVMPQGVYTVTVEVTGFHKAVHTSVTVDIGITVVEDFTMQVGAVSESVTVAATSLTLQTTESHIGRTVQMQDIDTLPQLGRTPIILAVYQPGVQNSTPGDPTFARINGTRQGSSNSTLDGIDVNDAVAPRLGLAMTANNSDSVVEVRMITNGGKAEYGRNAGGQVELVTRSGGNRFHGNLFDYLRNTDLNANDFFNNSSGVATPVLIQNVFGGSIGGRIKKDKLFFFYNTQMRRTTASIIRERTVLTASAKTGLYQWNAPGSTAVSQFNIAANDPRKIGVDKAMAALFAELPAPNAFDTGDLLNTAGYRFNNPNGSQENQNTWRFDYNATSNNHIFGRYSRETNSSIDSLNNADATYPGFPQGTQGGIRWGMSYGDDWVINPTTVNEFRYGHQSALVGFFRPGRPAGPQITSNSYTDPDFAGFPQGRNSPVDEFTDNLSKVKGNHTFKFGINTRWTLQNGYNDQGIYPTISLATTNGNNVPTTFGPGAAGQPAIASSDLTRYQNLYNDVLGRISSINESFYSNLTTFQAAGLPYIRNYNFRDYGAFAQDDWRVTKNLTINVGLRWEFSKAPNEQDALQGCIDQSAAINSVNQIQNLGVVKCQSWYKNDWNNFAPRFGFAWSPFGNSKTVVRGDYGIFFDRIVGATTSAVDQATPGFAQTVTPFTNSGIFPSTDNRVGDGLTAFLPVQPAAPVTVLPAVTVGSVAARGTSITVFNPNLATGYVQHISLGIQREIARNTVLNVSYVGTRGVKLFMQEDMNQQRIYGDFLTSFQQIQAFANPNYATNTQTTCPNTGPVPTNSLTKIFGSASAAVSAMGCANVLQSLVYTAATTVDRSNNAKYAAAGISNFYLRNYPQYNTVLQGTNDGRSYYDSMQISVSRQVGSLRGQFNYTWSKSMDNISVDANGFTAPIDNFNIRNNRARGDADIPQAINYALTYTLPFGKGHQFGAGWNRFMNTAFGGWDLGSLGVIQSGRVMTFTSGRATGAYSSNAWANYSGSRNIGGVVEQGNGVFYFTADQLNSLTGSTTPSLYNLAGSDGIAGRNTFRGPRYTNFDVSLVKRFLVTEKTAFNFRMEAYNLFNHANFNNPLTFSAAGTVGANGTNGKITSDIAPRIFQAALRFDF